MSQNKPKNLTFMERQVFKVVSPMLGVCYAMFREAGGNMSPEEYANAVRDYLKADDLTDDFKQYLKDYSDYMQKGN